MTRGLSLKSWMVLRRLEQAAGAWVLLPLDQAEALLTGERPAGDPAKLLLDALAQILGRRTRNVVVAATIRTEFMPRLEAVFAGPEVRLRQAPLTAIGSLAETSRSRTIGLGSSWNQGSRSGSSRMSTLPMPCHCSPTR
jgi:hypothetical protein